MGLLRMDRRDLFALQAWKDVTDLLSSCLPDASDLPFAQTLESSSDGLLLHFQRQAMATQFEIVFPLGQAHAAQLASGALDQVDTLESQLTVYRHDSEISHINREAAQHDITVEPRLFALLQQARQLFHQTQGAFDIAIGSLIEAWGFRTGPARLPSPLELQAARLRSGMGKVHLDDAQQTVRFQQAGIQLNLGSIGKGYALDRAAQWVNTQAGRVPLFLQAGGSSVLAVGAPPGQKGWRIGIKHPWEADAILAEIELVDQAMGTSSARYHHLEWAGEKLGHVLDPRSGWPAKGISQACAFAPEAAQADALASAFFVLGPADTAHYCAAHPGVGALLLEEATDQMQVFGTARQFVSTIAAKKN